MRITAKRLSELTQVPAANIRKWRERYHILDPERGDNGYLYYTSEDYRVLLSISRMLNGGMKLSTIMKQGRAALLEKAPSSDYSPEELAFLEQVIENNFMRLSHELDAVLRLHGVEYLVRKRIGPQAVLVGKAWEAGFITVGTEHAYSRWIMGYLSQLALRQNRKTSVERLFVAFPGDEHELGSMMHYTIMCAAGQGGRFSGALSLDRLFEELSQGDYDEVHISATMPRTRAEIDKLVHSIHRKFPRLKIKIGGSGARPEGQSV
ncbi:MAG: MerR family transcriptional regulator [Spirochaetes bacterium]|nr:MerR family transcriptional regulator [Spirochaetota bacterium]MBX3722953.1 MerR family transcriptional regulator [Turneriella sp.]